MGMGELVGGLVRFGLEIAVVTGDGWSWDDNGCGGTWDGEPVLWGGVGCGGVTLLGS